MAGLDRIGQAPNTILSYMPQLMYEVCKNIPTHHRGLLGKWCIFILGSIVPTTRCVCMCVCVQMALC